jgi:hypothetical protein
MVLSTIYPGLRKFRCKNIQNFPFGEGQVQDHIPALPGFRSKILAALLENT